MSKNSERIKVSVRCRPMSDKERREGYQSCVEVDSDRGEVIVSIPNQPIRNFFYDKVYGITSTQDQVFQETAMPIVESVCQGYNGTIFAYGQTGTGKTFTMEGDFQTDINKGIIPRSFDLMFSLIKGTYNTNFLIRCSYLELYNEEVRDLLAKNHQQKLDIREDPETGFYVEDLSTWVVKSPSDMIELMLRGRELKVIKGHNMNERSSRSHCIFTIIVENSTKDEKGGDHIKKGKLNLVDLAGSERTNKIKEQNGAEGLQKETIHINLSLTALGKVIVALVSNKKQHVPYRDSKLTKLLMDSLGGNSKTVMIANIGPADFNYEETVTTLRYADRAKNIKNAPKINEDPKDAMIRKYQEELNRLKAALAAAGDGGEINLNDLNSADIYITNDSRKKIQELQEKFKHEQEAFLKNNEAKKKEIEESVTIVEAEKYRLLEELKSKQAEQEKRNEQKEKLVAKLKQLEEKFVIGEENEKKAKENEQKIKKAKEELEEREKQRLLLQKKLQENDEKAMTLQQKYKNQDQEIEKKKEAYDKLKNIFENTKRDIEDLKRDFEISSNQFYEEKKQMEKILSYNEKIIEAIIPKKYYSMIEDIMDYDEEKDEWFLNGIEEGDEKVNEKKNYLALGYDDEEDDYYYDQSEEPVQLKELIEMGNQPKSVYLTYDNVVKMKKRKNK